MTERRKPLLQSQKIALLLLEEKIEALKSEYIERMAELKRDWKELVITIGEENGIDSKSQESQNWKLLGDRNAFVYRGKGSTDSESNDLPDKR